MTALIVDDLDELRTLHGMLFARKFDGPEDIYFGSPLISSVQRRLLEVLREREPNKPWAAWSNAADHDREVEKVRSYLRHSGGRLRGRPLDQVREVVRDLLAPLEPSEQLVAELVESMEAQ